MKFEQMIKEIKYVEHKNRDKKYWKLTIDTLNKMCSENPIFLRGMLSVIISEHKDLHKNGGGTK